MRLRGDKGLTAKHTKDWVKFSQWVWEGFETLVVGGRDDSY